MTLTAGDFFAGTYQLREALTEPTTPAGEALRWHADDYSANRQEAVVLDVVPHDYDEALHWLAEVPGLRKVGQTTSPAAWYFAWEPGKAQSLVPFDPGKATPAERRKLADLIGQLHIAAHETIAADDNPEFWRTPQNDWVVFYRKHSGQATSYKEKQAVREQWIGKLDRPAAQIALPKAEHEAGPSEPQPDTVSSPRWPLFIVGGGIILLAGLYLLVPPPPPPSRVAFDRAIERGVQHEKNGEYESAVEAFKIAASAPPSDELDARLDSLARRYEALGRRECDRYQTTGSRNLYFIPNQYFQYTAILSRRPESDVEACE